MIVADLLQLRKITEAEKQTLDLTYPLIIANDDTDDIEMWDGNEWVVLTDGKSDKLTLDFMSGVLTTTIYSPFNMKIESITDVKNAPTTVITKNGNSYVLGNSISMGDTLVFTVSIASVIKLNLKYV